MVISVVNLIYDIFSQLGKFVDTLKIFLTYEISIPLIGNVSVLGLIGGSLLITFLIAGIINKLSPL